jgi:hypothetical protein
MKRYYKNPARAQKLKENGCIIRITRGEGDNLEIIKEYSISPEEIQEQCKRRDMNLKEMLETERVQR